MARELWTIIADLQVSSTEAKIVGGTKAIHPVLPNLLPPVDREYTLRFFLHVTTIKNDEQRETFELIYTRFCEIGRVCRESINSALANGNPWNTSFTKVIDNTIVGYVLDHPGV